MWQQSLPTMLSNAELWGPGLSADGPWNAISCELERFWRAAARAVSYRGASAATIRRLPGGAAETRSKGTRVMLALRSRLSSNDRSQNAVTPSLLPSPLRHMAPGEDGGVYTRAGFTT